MEEETNSKNPLDHIERVQHRFTKHIGGMEGFIEEKRLVANLQLPTLQYKRKRERLI